MQAHEIRGLFRAIIMPSYKNYKEVVFIYEQRKIKNDSRADRVLF